MIALAHMDMDYSSEKKNIAPNEKQKRSYLYKKIWQNLKYFGWNFPLSTDFEIGRNEDSNWHFLH